MNNSVTAEPASGVPSTLMADWRDYFALLKPRVMTLVIFTAACAMVAAPGAMHPFLAFTGILCIAVAAGAAGALNQWYEADIDAVMKRTAKRPLPAGKLQKPEALAFGEKAGLDGEAVVEVIAQGAAGSWQMANRHKTMLAGQFDFGFAVDWMRKDLKICLETADEIGASLPVTALVDQFYKDVQQMGGKRNDTSSLIRRLRGL